MEISVVIPCFDGNATLPLQLEGLARQEDAPPFEVLVVDNNSTEPPDAVVEQWRTRLPNLRLVPAHAHKGTSYARNVGISHSRSELIVFCDADDVVGPRFLRAAFAALQQVDVVIGDVQPLPASEFEHGLDAVWASLESRTRLASDTGVDLDAPDVCPRYPTLMGGACGFRLEALQALDGWDQGFFPGAEDNDLGLRVLEAGFVLGKSWAMTLAERSRSTGAQMFRRSFDAGAMHMRLCAAHDLWSVSPHLREPRWWVDLAKLPAVAVRTLIRDRDPATRQALMGRIGLRCGQAQGFWTHRVRRRRVSPQTGVGLTPRGQAASTIQ